MQTTDVVIRRATKADLPVLGRLGALLVRAHYGFDPDRFLTPAPQIEEGDMKTSHAGLGITEADWTRSVNHLVATLAKFKVPQKEQDELLATAGSLKKDIVEK